MRLKDLKLVNIGDLKAEKGLNSKRGRINLHFSSSADPNTIVSMTAWNVKAKIVSCDDKKCNEEI